jgi:hypothetical protein
VASLRDISTRVFLDTDDGQQRSRTTLWETGKHRPFETSSGGTHLPVPHTLTTVRLLSEYFHQRSLENATLSDSEQCPQFEFNETHEKDGHLASNSHGRIRMKSFNYHAIRSAYNQRSSSEFHRRPQDRQGQLVSPEILKQGAQSGVRSLPQQLDGQFNVINMCQFLVGLCSVAPDSYSNDK